MGKIINPVLRGFNPDPSILRVGDDYYLATSTFEWFPGVMIYHSKDLIHWKPMARPLNRLSQLDMHGDLNSGGIWAPCLTYDKGFFYLIYTDVKAKGTIFKDTHNFLVTTTDIMGDWSEPIYLNSSGFDPSLFHDDNGRKWLVNMVWDYRKSKNSFGGILLQEYSLEEKRLVGPITNIFKGTSLGKTEGPHLYKWFGKYYLLCAEGGTGLNHAVTIARSSNITGPYEVDPTNPIMTTADDPTFPLQKAGHGDIVETQNSEWYMAHLCARPIPRRGRSILGRETSIQKMMWTEDGWLRLASGGHKPQVEVEAPTLPEHSWETEPVRDDFYSSKLSIHFHTLRVPADESWLSLTERKGYLRLRGRESIASKFNQSLVARRQQAFRYTASTCIEFEPETFQQMAGLICMYDTQNFYYLRVSWDEKLGKCLGIITCKNNLFDQPLTEDVKIEGWQKCYLQVKVDYDRLQFYYSPDGEAWKKIGPVCDASTLSDECCMEGSFTGAFVGLCCHDITGRRKHADFDYFEYIERED